MSFAERMGLAVLRRLDPEFAHGVALRALRLGLVPLPGVFTSPRLTTKIAGFDLPNPIGLAAGFDKNAVALAALSKAGFGFLEVGAATPRPQAGNPRPRLFRLPADSAVINRFAFNNEGADAIARRLAMRPAGCVVGLNIGANHDSPDRAADYAAVLQTCAAHVDFVTVNVSSPNTAGLRSLQRRDQLWSLLAGVIDARGALSKTLPVFLKISPDLEDAELSDIARVARDSSLDGIIATNTTVSRNGLQSRHADETGGLSGTPLFAPSTRILARLSRLTHGEVPLIGVGGIASAADTYAKIRAGAAAVQLYTALAYRGLSLVDQMARGLDELLKADGFTNVADAIGTDRARWLD